MAAQPVRMAPTARSKYRAVKVTVDGITFASKAEAKRFGELKLLEKAGAILNLRRQPRFPLLVQPIVPGDAAVSVGVYVADYAYETVKFKTVVEDVKGVSTPVYRLKKKIVEALYGIEIREIR